MAAPQQLPRRPEARSEKVEELVDRVVRGHIRVPRFQRNLKWERDDVLKLFESIYRGYPIGSLLFYKDKAPAGRLQIGPLVVEPPELESAWWVVDGQQRLTSLAAALARPTPIPTRPDDPYVVYFDPERQTFEPPPKQGEPPSAWVPLPYLLDASRLSEWVFGWPHKTNEALRKVVFEAGTRIREYAIPLYLIQVGDPTVAEEIFDRVNRSGKPLEWPDVYKALFGGAEASPSDLEELAVELQDVGMGRLDEKRLLTSLFSLKGLDPTRTLGEHLQKNRSELAGAVKEALPVLRRVLSFLRQDAGIPHLRLLPKSVLLDVLTRFFVLHENPNPRTRILLRRWFWRNVLGAGTYDDRTLRRRGISAVVEDDEEESVQELLRLVGRDRHRPFELPQAFDARADATRITLLALVHRRPSDLASGEPIQVASLVEEQSRAAFVKVAKQGGGQLAGSPANRLIQRKGTPVGRCITERWRKDSSDPVLRSHVISASAAQLLAGGDLEGFLVHRWKAMTQEVRSFVERMAEWDHSDRPSVDRLLVEAGL